MIGGILEVCEIEGFLTNLHLVEGEGDRDRQSWTGFLGSLLASPKFTLDKPMTIAEITGFYASMGTDQPLLAVNGGYRVKTGDDGAQIVNSMERCFDKMVGQIYRI